MNTNERQNTKARDHAEAQRDRILEAAERCFIEHGFHAASMANISEAAQMSAGLIYRYFESKNAIILAIIERQLQEKRASIAELQPDADLAPKIKELFVRWQSRDTEIVNPALFLEMSAQAARDPQIAQAVGNADRVSRADGHAWFERVLGKSGRRAEEEDVRGRAFVLQCFVDGLAIRACREPDLDPAFLDAGLKALFPHLVSLRDN